MKGNMQRLKWLVVTIAALAWGVSPLAQTTATVMPDPRIQFVGTTGVPISGGFLYTYAAGTTTPQATCATNTITAGVCGVLNANPIVLDAAGRAAVYLLPASYKFILQTSAGVQVWSQDNVAALLPYNQSTLTGTLTFSPATILTVSGNAITPTLNVHAVDTSGGAANLNTLNTGSVTAPFFVILYGNNPGGNPVTVKNGTGNIVLAKGDFALNTASRYIMLMLSGTTWYEISRSDLNGAVIGPELKNYYETKTTSSIAAGVVAIDLSLGNHFAVPLTAAINSFTITNIPATGKTCAFALYMTADGTPRAITFSFNGVTVKWPSATAPTPTSTNTKIDVYTFVTYDAGASWFGFISGQNF